MQTRKSSDRFEIYECTSWGGPLHFHAQIEVLILEEGEAEVWLDHTPKILKQNEIAVSFSFDAHRFRALCEPCRATLMRIPPSLCEDFIHAIQHKSARNHFIRDPEAVQKIRNAAAELRFGALNGIEQIGYIHIVLGTVLKQLEFDAAGENTEQTLPAKLLSYVDAHYREDLSVETIAQALGYSANHVSKCFRTCFHTPISRYINTLRLKKAVLLLQKREQNVSQCALESGFGSVRTFYRLFTEEFGCSPREFLQSNV